MPKFKEKLAERSISSEEMDLSETELEELVRSNIDRIMLRQFCGNESLFREINPDK